MKRQRFLFASVRVWSIGLAIFAAVGVLSQAASVPGWLPPYVSSNDFLTGGSPLNGAVVVTSPWQGDPSSGLRSGFDPAGYVARARRTNPVWALGDFVPIYPMTEFRHGAGVVIARGPVPMQDNLALSPPRDSVSYLYIVGGKNQAAVSGTIERAEIDADGNVFPGLEAPAGLLQTPRYGAAVVARGDFIYVVGGYDATDLPVKSVERFQIDPWGNLGQPAFQENPGWGGDVSAVILNGYLYVMGGSDSKRGPVQAVLPYVKRAAIRPRGDLAPFEALATATTPPLPVSMPVGVAGGRAVVVAGWEGGRVISSIYYLGGNVGNPDNGASRNVYRLKVADDNAILGDWAPVPEGAGFVELLDPRELFAAVATNGYLYVIGGESTTQGVTTYYSLVERAALGPGGSLGPFIRLDGNNATYINRFDRASDIRGAVLNNRMYVPGGRDAGGNALDQIFELSLDQGGDSLLSEAVLDASVLGLVSDLGQQIDIESLAFDVGPDKTLAAGILVRFRSAAEGGDWGAWTPYFSLSALPRDHAPAHPIPGEDPYLLDLAYAPGAPSCLDGALVPNPTDRTGPIKARHVDYEVVIPEGGADQQLQRLAVNPHPIARFALPGGYDPTKVGGPYPPSCAPGHAIADMGVKSGWVRFTGVGFSDPDMLNNSGCIGFVSADPQAPAITVRAVEVRDAGHILDLLIDVGEGPGGPFTYDFQYGPIGGITSPVTVMSPAIKVYPSARLEDSRSHPGLDVNLGNAVARENVLQAPTPQQARQKVTVALFGDNFRSGRVDDTGPLALDDPMGTGTWPSNPYAAPESQVSVLRYQVVDRTEPPSAAFKPLKLWDASDIAEWRDVARGEFGSATDFRFDLEVSHKVKSGPHDLEITVQNPQLGRTVTVTQTVYIVPAFGVESFQNRQDPAPDPSPGAANQYDWTGSKDPAVADLGDGVGTSALTIDVTGHGFQSDTGTSLITGVAPVSTSYAPSAGTHTVSDPNNLSFTSAVPGNTIPKLYHFAVNWAYQLGVSDPYLAGTQVPPIWDGPETVTRAWTPEAGSWLGLYVVPPRVKIQSVLGSHNTDNPIIVLQSDPTLTVNGGGFATHGPAVGDFQSVLHEARLVSMVNSPDEDILPMPGGMHMVSDCQARLTMDVTETQRPGEAYKLEIQTYLPDLAAQPGSLIRHPYSLSQSASLVTVLPLPVCQAVAPTCLRADQGTRVSGVVVTGKNFDMGTKVDLGPGITIENLDVCHDDAARGCVAQDTLTFDAVVSPLAAPGARTVRIENGLTSGISQQASCASPANDFWVVPVPSVSSVQPSSIQQPPMAAGVKTVPIDVYGSNFVAGATIEITLAGGAPASDVTVKGPVVVVDSGHLTAELIVRHAAPEGGYTLKVIEPAGPACGTASKTADGSFQVMPFREISLSAVTNQTAQCQGRSGTLAVTGANFKDPAGGILVASASLGVDVAIDALVVSSETSITIDYSIGDGAAIGKRPLVLHPVTQGATPATWPDALTVTSSPSIVSASPAAIPGGTTRQITLSGRNFYELGATITVTPSADITVSNVSVVNTGQILVTVTAAPTAGPEPRSITVTNGDGGQCNVATLAGSFRIIPDMAITGVANATSQCQGRSGALTVTGRNFKDPTGASLVASVSLGPDVSIDSLVIDTATQMTIGYVISEGAALGRRDLTVTCNVQGAAPASWADALRITSSPSIISVSPRLISSGTEKQITITGRNFYEHGAAVTVTPDTGVTVSGVSVVNGGQILATLTVDAAAPPDARTIAVTNADGGQCAVATLNAAIQVVDPPHVISWTYQRTRLQITGTNFHPSLKVYVGGSSTQWQYYKMTRLGRRNTTLILNRTQQAFPKGVPVEVRLVNPDDGGETIIIVTG